MLILLELLSAAGGNSDWALSYLELLEATGKQ